MPGFVVIWLTSLLVWITLSIMSTNPTRTRATIIAFASPKGGVGKSTTCAALAASLAKRGHKVIILDLDQNRTLEQWAHRFPAELKPLTIRGIGEGALIETIEQLYSQNAYVLVDVAGAFHKTTIAAATLADLTITPSRLSAPDIIEAVKLNQQIRQLGAKIGKPIDHRLLLNGVSPIWPTYQRAALVEVERSGIPSFQTIIHDRAPYAEMFLTGQPPHFADQTREPVIKAVAQIEALTNEVLAALSGTLNEREAA